MSIFTNKKKTKRIKQNKGHKNELNQFFEAVKQGKECSISFEDIYWSTKMTFDVIKSIRTGKTVTYA